MKVELRLNTGRTYTANVPDNFTDEQITLLVNSELDLWNETVAEIISKEIYDKSEVTKAIEEENKIIECTDMTYKRAKGLFDDMCSKVITYGALYLDRKAEQVFKVMWQKIDEALEEKEEE